MTQISVLVCTSVRIPIAGGGGGGTVNDLSHTKMGPPSVRSLSSFQQYIDLQCRVSISCGVALRGVVTTRPLVARCDQEQIPEIPMRR